MSDRRPASVRWFESFWYRQAWSWQVLVLWPLSWVFRLLAAVRRAWQRSRAARLPVPVIVVGNIAVGGTGKTPLIEMLVLALRKAGWHPGVISRGYGAAIEHFPAQVPVGALAERYGDEPAMLAALCPVVVDPDRVRGARYLLDRTPCDIVLSDDGLQHYRLARTVDIAVIDASRGLGNGHCLPAGPLREPVSRLRTVDFIVSNGGHTPVHGHPVIPMETRPVSWRHLATGKSYPLEPCPLPRAVHALAGIGHPQRFFRTLQSLGLAVDGHSYPDHHVFAGHELEFPDDRPVVMTSKDAVKCHALVHDRVWVLDVQAVLPDDFMKHLLALLPKREG